MANRCPSCGGTLHFDIQKQKLVCEYCESEFDPSSIKEMTGAGESVEFGSEPVAESDEESSETIDAKIFTCPNCGATANKIRKGTVDYCQFCGTAISVDAIGQAFLGDIYHQQTPPQS